MSRFFDTDADAIRRGALSLGVVSKGAAGVPRKPHRVRLAMGFSFEMLSALWAFLDDENRPVYETSADWLRRVDRRLGTEAAAIRRFAGGSLHFWDHVLGLAVEAGAPYDVPGLRRLIETMDGTELRHHLLGMHNGHVSRTADPELIRAVAAGDAVAQRTFRRGTLSDDAPWQKAVRHILRVDGERLREELLHVLQRWHDVGFGPEEEEIHSILERELARVKATGRGEKRHVLLDRVTDNMRWAIDASQRDVLLAPSYVARPFIYYVEHRGTTLILFPVSDDSISGDGFGPSARLVQLAKALGDEGRVRVLHALRERDMTTSELVELLGVPRTTLWHHVLILRGAGLIRPTGKGPAQRTFGLREEALSELSDLLDGFVAGQPPARVARPVRRR
jgi:DNA-binding transcriptional ArsR family regulator